MKDQKMMPPSPFVDAEAAARYLGISLTTVYRLARTGKLPNRRVGKQVRIPMAELEKFTKVI